ncbi:MAG: OmpA family protein [Clostridiaceae bacterium]|nr:OmpA family protein [Clostridiaceae bacterium]HPU44655.1 OmpA family protein [Thermoclostridium sp.]
MKLSGLRRETEEESFWPSFTDVMSSLVFVLFFFIIIMVIRQIVNASVWDARLLKADQALAGKQRQLEALNSSLESVSQELDIKMGQLENLESALSEREAEIESLMGQLEQDRAALLQKEQELAEVRSRLQEISVLRLSILGQVKDSIEKELGSVLSNGGEPLVAIDDNANLVINSSLLFDKGSSRISPSGHKLLEKFALAFERILSDPETRKNIDSIIVSGYADSDDTFDYNYNLSCQRAIAVIVSMMKSNPVLETAYGAYFQASGFSEFRPVALGEDEAAKSKNRRIQISINIKDANIQKIITDYMSGQ